MSTRPIDPAGRGAPRRPTGGARPGPADAGDGAPPPGAPAYAEGPAGAPLDGSAACVWRSAGAGTAHVLPDGCVDLLVAVGAGGRVDASVVGAMTRPLVVRRAPGGVTVGVRLRPGHARALAGRPAAELTDLRVPLHDLWAPADADALLDAAARALAADPAGASLPAALAAALGPRVARAAPPPRDVRAALGLLARAHGRLAVGALADAVGVTRQHLARRFVEHVGVSPKSFARVARVRHVLREAARAAHAGGAVRWSALALDAGYCDQAHLVRDFGALVGATPAEWLAARAAPAVPLLQDRRAPRR